VEAGVNETLRTWDCKVPWCEETAYKGSGPYAMLCRLHTEEAREEARQAKQNGAGPATLVKPAPSFEFRAASLVQLGKQLDDALANYEPAREALEEAYRRWREAVAELPAETADANAVLTNGLAQAVTTGDPASA
jgi:hypothetical protein